jgi:hypothetical protein
MRNTMKALEYSVLTAAHLPNELDWDECLSSVVEMHHIDINGDIVELLEPDAILRIDHAVPTRGFISLRLQLSRIPDEPGQNGKKPVATIFSNRTVTSVPEKGWPTMRLELVRLDDTQGALRLNIAQSDNREWRILDSSRLLRIDEWYSVTVSWGVAMSIAVASELDEASRLTVDTSSVPAVPFSSGLHFLGLGRVDRPVDQGIPLWSPPSLAGAKIGIPGVCFGEASNVRPTGEAVPDAEQKAEDGGERRSAP